MSSTLRLLALSIILSVLAACASSPKPVGPGDYRVVRGDTLYRIAMNHGQSVNSLMRANNITNPRDLKVGQVLKVSGGSASAPASRAQGSAPAASSASATKKPAPPPPPAPAGAIKLTWPADGTVDSSIKGPNPNGLFIVNKAGTPVKAVAAGKVAYAGNKLRGYGNLIIINHASGYISVYAHNRSLSVKDGDQVRQGQTIAAMGNTESAHTALYFELRHNGKPVNARSYLPRR
jgi:murein DD-endopeptidase MepM/ murein hydrolase activator NlpD